MSSLSSLEKRIRLTSKKPYLAQLSGLLGREVSLDELNKDDEEFSKISKIIKDKFLSLPILSYEIPFSEKKESYFKNYIHKLFEANPSLVYVRPPLAHDCKMSLVASLQEINWDFDFWIYPEGIVSFTTVDFQDSLLLDWREESEGKVLIFETQGENWGAIEFN